MRWNYLDRTKKPSSTSKGLQILFSLKPKYNQNWIFVTHKLVTPPTLQLIFRIDSVKIWAVPGFERRFALSGNCAFKIKLISKFCVVPEPNGEGYLDKT
jgi:hypothetical protein